MTTAKPAKLKETYDIEQVLDWAYRVQCVDRRVARQRAQRGPARYPSSTPFAAFEALGTRVDTSGVVMDDPTNIKVDDALIIHDAVLRLSEMWIEWRGRDEVLVWDHAAAKAAGKVIEQVNEQWCLVDIVSAAGVEPIMVNLEQAGTAVLVIIHAKSGLRPEVHEDWVEPRGAVAADSSKQDKWGRKRRVHEGVIAQEVMHARAIYTVWHAALALLAIELEGVLDRFEIAGPPAAPAQPWTAVRGKVLKQVSIAD